MLDEGSENKEIKVKRQVAGTVRISPLHLPTTSERRRMSSGLLAAVATDPGLLAPLQERFREWVVLLDHDGVDPVTSSIVHLVANGLWLVELCGLSAPDEAMKGKIIQAIEEMIQLNLPR